MEIRDLLETKTYPKQHLETETSCLEYRNTDTS